MSHPTSLSQPNNENSFDNFSFLYCSSILFFTTFSKFTIASQH